MCIFRYNNHLYKNKTVILWRINRVTDRLIMNIDIIIDKIELAYGHYIQQGSEIMFNTFTDHFFDKLDSMPSCKLILEDLESQHKIDQKVFEERIISEYFYDRDFFVCNESYYVAYCYQYYKFLRNRQRTQGNYLNPYFKEVIWTDKSVNEEGDRMKLYKTDYVRPLVNYIIDHLKNESLILHCLLRYKSRVERFKTIQDLDLTESIIQRDLALYLFDNGVEFSKEDDTCNGRLDFRISDASEHYGAILKCNNKSFVVETKLMKKVTIGQIRKSIAQLKAYMNQMSSYGCLVVFASDDNVNDIVNSIKDDITIIPIYWVTCKTLC